MKKVLPFLLLGIVFSSKGQSTAEQIKSAILNGYVPGSAIRYNDLQPSKIQGLPQLLASQGNKTKRTILTFGDSFMFLNFGPQLDGSFSNYFPQGILNWANVIASQRCEFVMNAGVSGNTTSQMVARYKTDVIPYKHDLQLVYAGINDISGITDATSYSLTMALAKQNLAKIYRSNDSLGITTLAMTLMPVQNNYQTNWLTPLKRQAISELNGWIRYKSKTAKSIVLVDAATVYLDPMTDVEPIYPNSVGGPFPTYSIDGLHPSATGAFAVGRMLGNILITLCPPANLLQYGGGSASLVANPSFSGISGTATLTAFGSTTLVNGWSIINNNTGSPITLSYTPSTDVGALYGNWLKVSFASTTTLLLTQYIFSGFAIGGTYKACFEAELENTSTAGIGSMSCSLSTQNASASPISQLVGMGDNAMLSQGLNRIVDPQLKMGTGVVETPPVTVTPDTAFMVITITVIVPSGTTGTINWKIRKPTLIRIS